MHNCSHGRVDACPQPAESSSHLSLSRSQCSRMLSCALDWASTVAGLVNCTQQGFRPTAGKPLTGSEGRAGQGALTLPCFTFIVTPSYCYVITLYDLPVPAVQTPAAMPAAQCILHTQQFSATLKNHISASLAIPLLALEKPLQNFRQELIHTLPCPRCSTGLGFACCRQCCCRQCCCSSHHPTLLPQQSSP